MARFPNTLQAFIRLEGFVSQLIKGNELDKVLRSN